MLPFVEQALPWPFPSQPRDFSLPNSSWGSEMVRVYEHYNRQCEVETEEGEKKRGPWRRLPSYNRSLKFATGTMGGSAPLSFFLYVDVREMCV